MGLGQELAVAAKCVWIQVGHPFTLVYPVLTAAFALGASALFLGYALAGLTGVVESNVLLVGVALVAYVLLLPVGVVFLMVAYSYELNERYNGRRPVPLEGAVVASRKFPEIAVSAVIVAVAFNACHLARWRSRPSSSIRRSRSATATPLPSSRTVPTRSASAGALHL